MRIGLLTLELLCESCIFLLLFLSKPSEGRDAVLPWPPYTCLTWPGSESVNRIQHGWGCPALGQADEGVDAVHWRGSEQIRSQAW